MAVVTVASKLPWPVMLHVDEMVDVEEQVFGGGVRIVSRARQKGASVKINGMSHPVDKAPLHQIIGGYALTPNVDADFWATWLKQNSEPGKESEMVKNRLIFAHEKSSYAESQSREQAAIRSGLEPIDPSKLPRGIQKADSKVA